MATDSDRPTDPQRFEEYPSRSTADNPARKSAVSARGRAWQATTRRLAAEHARVRKNENDLATFFDAGKTTESIGADLERKIHVIRADAAIKITAAERTSMAFLDVLSRNGSRVSIQPQDESGLLDLDSMLDARDPDTAVSCCGPEDLLAAVERRCQSWPADTLHVERFSASPERKVGPEHPIEVVLQQSQQTLQVPPNTSILHAIEAAGVDVPSCQEGTCGTCETDVLKGIPDHRDHVLSTAERELLSTAERERCDCMMICVSRCHGPRLVLDL